MSHCCAEGILNIQMLKLNCCKEFCGKLGVNYFAHEISEDNG